MIIAFATTLSFKQSTMIGRVIPLAKEFSKASHKIHILHLDKSHQACPKNISCHQIGNLPFQITKQGKFRLSGTALLLNLKLTAVKTAVKLWQLKPDVIIIVKPLPHNVAGVMLGRRDAQIILDADDFELTANQLTSITHRAGIHWAERAALKMASAVAVASPFLHDRYKQLTSKFPNPPKIHLIPTGIHHLSFSKKTSTPRLVYLGSLSISSGHRIDLLPDILKKVKQQIPDIKLLIAGHGHDRQKLEKLFAKSGLSKSVSWHGRFDLNEIDQLINQDNILIDPIDSSITQRAKSSFRCMLAGITGTPIVTSNVGVRPQLLPRDLHHRFFANPEDTQDYAQKIIDFIKSPLPPIDQEIMKQLTKQFTWPILGKAYLDIITK